ncbi:MULTISPECIES: hypothetical protein [unclassified Rhizobium]|uniref:hypothetical protein n=1 Tax=unclassified Rhizobium TaxID=2613769 RepID=UPI0037F385DC
MDIDQHFEDAGKPLIGSAFEDRIRTAQDLRRAAFPDYFNNVLSLAVHFGP